MKRRDLTRGLGAAIAGACAGASAPLLAFTKPSPARFLPRAAEPRLEPPFLSDEALGWLAHLKRKVELGGRWRREDIVHEAWDTRSFVPTMSKPRYELTWISWVIGLMAEATPAWREIYAPIMRYAADRYLEYWAFHEWVENRGDDPKRGDYPEAYKVLIPEGHFGRYNLVGWAGNGANGHPYDPDPIRAAGSMNLMYKGYLNLVLSTYAYVCDDGRYENGFEVVYDESLRWRYTQRELNALLADQWGEHPEGMACEVSKVYPWCNVESGLGVVLYDALRGTHHAGPYRDWLREMSGRYLARDDAGRVSRLTAFYDSDLKTRLDGPAVQSSGNFAATIWHLLPVNRPLATELYETSLRLFLRAADDGSAFAVAWATPTAVESPVATGLLAAIAQELGDTARFAALRQRLFTKYEPRREPERGEFSFDFGFGEPWPRGQYNGWVMPALVASGPGQWSRVFAEADTKRFSEPTLEGVDFPRLRPRRVRWDAARRRLEASFTHAAAEANAATLVAVTGLPGGVRCQVKADGDGRALFVNAEGTLKIPLAYGVSSLVIEPALGP